MSGMRASVALTELEMKPATLPSISQTKMAWARPPKRFLTHSRGCWLLRHRCRAEREGGVDPDVDQTHATVLGGPDGREVLRAGAEDQVLIAVLFGVVEQRAQRRGRNGVVAGAGYGAQLCA